MHGAAILGGSLVISTGGAFHVSGSFVKSKRQSYNARVSMGGGVM